MNEHATGTCGQKIQHVAFENAKFHNGTRRSCGAGVYDTDSLQIADLADEIVEPLIVDRNLATKDIDVFGCQRLILSKGRVDRVGVKAVRCDLLVLKVLAENGGNQTLSDAALSLQDDMDF